MPIRQWSTTASLSTGRVSCAGGGTALSGIIAGGSDSSLLTSTEEFSSLTWTSGGNLSEARMTHKSAGTQTAFNVFTGNGDTTPTDTTEEYSGISWSSGGALTTGRTFPGGCGTQTASLCTGGNLTGTTNTVTSEEYNGTSWSAGADLNYSMNGAGVVGSQLAAVSCGGEYLGNERDYNEEFNGTSWATATGMPDAFTLHGMLGSASDATAAGGDDNTNDLDTAYHWNGTSWSTGSDLPATRQAGGCCTTLFCGGTVGGSSYQASVIDLDEFETVGSVTIAPSYYFTQSGTDTSVTMDFSHAEDGDTLFCIVGKDDDVATTGPSGWTRILNYESNNAIWQEVWKREATGTETTYTWSGDSEEYILVGLAIGGVDYSTITTSTGALGSSTAPSTNSLTPTNDSLILSGITVDNAQIPHTMENRLMPIVEDMQTTSGGAGSVGVTMGYAVDADIYSVWSASNDLNTARIELAGCGTQTAGLSFGGDVSGSASAVTEEYGGSTWTTAGSMDLNTARKRLAGCGTQTAGLSFGGYITAVSGVTEEYDGSTWTSSNSLSTARYGLGGCGTQTAGLSFAGYDGSDNSVVTEEYNGTSWSAGGNVLVDRYYISGFGTQTAGLNFGGAPSEYANTEEYNGTSWSSANDLLVAVNSSSGAGTQNAGLAIGGNTGSATGVTQEYDGTAWKLARELNTPRFDLAGCGTTTVALSFAGYDTASRATTEELNPLSDTSSFTFDYTINATDQWTAWSLYVDLAAGAADIIFRNKLDNISCGEVFNTAAQLNGVLVI